MDTQNTEPLIYEETPVIGSFAEKDLPNPLDTPELVSHNPRNPGKKPSRLGMVFLFLLLFVFGVFASTYIRPFFDGISFPTFIPSSQNEKETTQILPPTDIPVDETATWSEYSVKAGNNTLSYRLPVTVLAPICDGQTCKSEGTYLEGGTRFTISTKITTTPIVNFEKLIVKDAGGKVFETKETTVAGFVAVDYAGVFTGLTTGGYTFTRMHGVMIQITPTVTVELNHFAPNGITTEFEKDDAVFSDILKTVTITSSPSATVK